VRFPSGVDVRTYEGQLFERWANHALGHRTAQVGTDGSVKLRQRIPEPALRLLEAGSVPHLIALTVAAYLSCIAPMPGFDPGPHARAMVDPAREELARLADTSTDGRHLAQRVIAELHLFGQDLAEQPTFISRVGELIDTIRRHGVDAAIRDSIAASQAPMTTTGANR
jgi:fructuronate reductase